MKESYIPTYAKKYRDYRMPLEIECHFLCCETADYFISA